MSLRRAIAAAWLLAACDAGGGQAAPPTGTPTDPVAVCTRAADVCKLDGSRLGVCTTRTDGALVCMSQH